MYLCCRNWVIHSNWAYNARLKYSPMSNETTSDFHVKYIQHQLPPHLLKLPCVSDNVTSQIGAARHMKNSHNAYLYQHIPHKRLMISVEVPAPLTLPMQHTCLFARFACCFCSCICCWKLLKPAQLRISTIRHQRGLYATVHDIAAEIAHMLTCYRFSMHMWHRTDGDQSMCRCVRWPGVHHCGVLFFHSEDTSNQYTHNFVPHPTLLSAVGETVSMLSIFFNTGACVHNHPLWHT